MFKSFFALIPVRKLNRLFAKLYRPQLFTLKNYMKTIRKIYQTLRQAENYQNRLYNKFDYVRLVKSPMFSESGEYVWEVK
jgi:hypothetical protein